MDAAKLREILKTQYGIKDDSEFNAAVEKSSGINLGPSECFSDCQHQTPG